jgi:hypothetical protein
VAQDSKKVPSHLSCCTEYRRPGGNKDAEDILVPVRALEDAAGFDEAKTRTVLVAFATERGATQGSAGAVKLLWTQRSQRELCRLNAVVAPSAVLGGNWEEEDKLFPLRAGRSTGGSDYEMALASGTGEA